MFPSNMGLGRNFKNSIPTFQLRINIHTRSRVISIAHPVLTIPYVWRVTHEYINEGLKQGLKGLGLQAIKGYNIVNIYKICFPPLIKFNHENKLYSIIIQEAR